jgi:FkbM family methyltransferase
MPLVSRVLRAYLRTDLRGGTRLTLLLARKIRQLQFVPITVADCAPLYVDLRKGHGADLLKGTPWPAAPWETDEQEVMRRVVRPGDVAFDVGANIGLHAVWLSRLVGPAGRLCVFEPNSDLLPQLGRTTAGLGNATLCPYGLSDRAQKAELFVPEDNSMASLADWTKGGGGQAGETRTVSCEVRIMDELVEAGDLPRPDFIKCDVEGAELMVFRGGRRTLDRTDAPVILFEANALTARGFGLEVNQAKDFLAGMPLARYLFFEVGEGGRLTRAEDHENIHSNILAVPSAKLDHLA